MTVVAETIVNGIIADLLDRVGLDEEWHALDSERKAEIQKTWISIVSKQTDSKNIGNTISLIVADLKNRKGLGDVWESIDLSVQIEIENMWEEIAASHLT